MAIKNTPNTPPPVLETARTRPHLRPSGTDVSEAFSTTSTVVPESEQPACDIEHVPVTNDPRAWSSLRKNATLALIASASMVSGLAANIQNPAAEQMESELHATDAQFSMVISMFILVQGIMPLFWSAISEVKGRKLVFLVSLALFTLGTVVLALSHQISLVIGFRCLQAAGSSAVMAIGAATLADIYEPAERGAKMGIYYIAPLLGPAIGPIFGGALATVWNWRAIYWFLAILSGTSFMAFILFFRDTFRSERSVTYQTVLKQHLRTSSDLPLSHHKDKEASVGEIHIHVNNTAAAADVEKAAAALSLPVKISVTDVNPFKPVWQVLRRKNNVVVFIASGLLFGFGFVVSYTMSRTLAEAYHYSPLNIGLITLTYGVGNVAGSVLGGRWSDHELARLTAANGGKSYPEMRLKSVIIAACLFPPCSAALGWICQQHVHVSAVCVLLFLAGFFNVWIYSSTLAYIVDSNVGRSSVVVAANSAFRGISAFAATETVVPLQDGLGDGWMFTIWGGIMALSGALIMLVYWKGGQWRGESEAREIDDASKLDSESTSNSSKSSKP